MEQAASQAIVVLGMHRSGTSAFTGLLNLLGVDLGPALMAAQEANAAGYWEHEDIVNAHEQLLIALNSSWDDYLALPPHWWTWKNLDVFQEQISEILTRDFSDRELWGVKDPRICRLLPFWSELLRQAEAEPLYVLVVRHPLETVRSLEKRNGFSPQKSQLLWLRHTLDAEKNTRGARRIVVTFDQFLADPMGTMERVRTKLGREWPVRLETISPEISRFVDPGKRHHRSGPLDERNDTQLASWTNRAYAAMTAGAEDNAEDAMTTLIDPLHRELQAADELFGALLCDRAGESRELLERIRSEFEMRLTQARSDLHAKLVETKRELKSKGERLRQLERSVPGKVAKWLRQRKPVGKMQFVPVSFPLSEHPAVSIILAGAKELTQIQTCFSSILNNGLTFSYEVIVVDDATEELDAIAKCKNVILVRNEIERGTAFSANRGAQTASAKWLIFVDSTAEPAPNALTALIAAATHAEDVGIVGAVVSRETDATNSTTETEFSGAVFLIAKNLFFQVGGFHRHYRNQRIAEADLAQKIRVAGRKVICEPKARAMLRSSSDQNGGELGKRDYEQSAKRFQRVWGIPAPAAV